MIEVNLYAIPSKESSSMVGRCVARSRFDKEAMGVSILEFTKKFLKENLNNFETSLGNPELVGFINSSTVMNTRDLSSINYCLSQIGYKVQIQNVADDEENASGVPTGDVVEWNIVDYNFIQYDYPTATKFIPAEGMDVPAILRKIVMQSGLFDPDKFSGVKNPFTSLLNNIDRIKSISGAVNPAIVGKIYSLLEEMGIKVFCATSED